MSGTNQRKKTRKSSVEQNTVVFWKHSFVSPLGEVELLSTASGVCEISLPGKKVNPADVSRTGAQNITILSGGAENRKAARQLNEYFRGQRRKFDFKIDLRVAGFYRRALLQGVAKIPYGQTRSYGEIARQVGSPRAARAVGSANATNPLPFVIPCHRVVASVGLGGYGGGLPMKRKLLKLESERATG